MILLALNVKQNNAQVFALPGAFGTPEDWAEVAARLPWANWHDIELWQEPAPYTAWASRFNAGARQQPRPRILMGYSLGGRLALHALVDAPACWDAAVILAAHPGLPCRAERQQRRLDDEAWAQRLEHLPWAAFWQQWQQRPVLAGAPRPAPEFQPGMKAALREWSLGQQQDLREALAALDLPILWLTGERDAKFTALVPPLRRGQQAVLPGCGHRLLVEAPQAVAPWVNKFLAEALP